MNNRIIILGSIFFLLTFFLQFIFIEDGDGYLYTELQESHMQEGKYKRDDNFWFNYALLSARYIRVNPIFTESLLDGENYFGVDKGKVGRFEAGGIISAYFKKEIMKNIIIENKLNLFQNYLEDPLNIDVDYTFSLEMSINRFFSTNLLLQLLYDDNALPEIQLKEVFGVSFNISF